MIHHFARRVWLVILLALVAGLTAWAVSQAGDPIYETRLTFVVRPDQDLSDDQVPDAVRNLGELRTTVSTVLATRRFLERAAEEAGLAPLDPSYGVSSAVEGESDIIRIVLEGPDRQALQSLGEAFVPIAGEWVGDVYRVYALETLAVDAPANSAGGGATRRIAIAAVLGALLGLGVVYLEWRARELRTQAQPLAPTGDSSASGSRAAAAGEEHASAARLGSRTRAEPMARARSGASSTSEVEATPPASEAR